MRVDGHVFSPTTFARVCGYVEQSDVHTGGLTVHESLVFSARLRLSREVPLARVLQHADEVCVCLPVMVHVLTADCC